MNFYIEEVASMKEIQIANYECFGWRLPDILPNRVKPQSVPEPNVPSSGVSRHGSQMTSEKSSAPGSRSHKTDANQHISYFEQNNTIYKEDRMVESSTYHIKSMDPMSTLRVTRSAFRNWVSELVVNKKMTEDSLAARQEVAELSNPDSSHRRYLETIMNLDSEAKSHISAKVTNGGHFKKATTSSRATKYLSDFRTKLQDDLTPQVDINHNGSTNFVQSELLVEHDTDRELEEPRKHFLQTVTHLDSKLRFLQADARRMQSDIKTLHRDFQVGLGGRVETRKCISLWWRRD
jgi:hypothetical protein